MKQHISLNQLNSLSEKGKDKLRKWWKPNPGDLYWIDWRYDHGEQMESPPENFPWTDVIEGSGDEDVIKTKKVEWIVDSYEPIFPLLSIGQMIEFLDEEQKYQFHIFRRTVDWKVAGGDLQYGKVIGEELCDTLWEAVKEVLEKEEE